MADGTRITTLRDDVGNETIIIPSTRMMFIFGIASLVLIIVAIILVFMNNSLVRFFGAVVGVVGGVCSHIAYEKYRDMQCAGCWTGFGGGGGGGGGGNYTRLQRQQQQPQMVREYPQQQQQQQQVVTDTNLI